jgi:acetoin utilization deacetylase AcuC-like enzyme
VNVPLEAGAVDEDYQSAFSAVVTPVLEQFRPELLLVSAGFDAHERDPLGGMRLTTNAFAAMTSELRSVAEVCCGGRLALVTEGGYDLQALAACLDGVVDVLVSAPSEPAWPTSGIASDRGRAAIAETKVALAPFWRLG